MDMTARLKRLRDFRDTMLAWYESADAPADDILSLRTRINEELAWIQREVVEAGCFKTVTVGPPPIVGGLVMKDLNPFDHIFDPPYRVSMVPMICDMLDQTIGVLKDGLQPGLRGTKSVTAFEAGFAFVAMPMDPTDPSLDDVLDAIKDACRELGIRAERVDDSSSGDRITDRILESIGRAQYVIVDLTHNRPNVYFEAGYAHGVGKLPVYIARDGTHLEFDLKDYPVIFYANMRGLRSELKKRLMGLEL